MGITNKLLEYLPQFNKTDKVFRDLFGNLDSPELSPVQNINDINSGSIFNSIEWHLRFQDASISSAILSNAVRYFLSDWANLLGVKRPSGLTDDEFVSYIVGYILSGECSYPKIKDAFPPPDFFVLETNGFGFGTEISATDVEIPIPGPIGSGVSSVITPNLGITYVLTQDPTKITRSAIIKINRILAAGTSVYLGVIQ